MALSADLHDKYVSIIDSILAGSDLSVISEKRIRKGIQEKVDHDISSNKAAIQEIIYQRFDIFNARQDPIPSVETTDLSTAPLTNGKHHSSASPSATPGKREVDEDDSSDVMDNPPPKKKRKASVDNDAAIAARLQAEEDKLARPSRTGTSRKAAPVKKKTPKKKTRAKITGSDDSEVDEEGSTTKRKVNRDTGFHKPLNLSPALADLFGESSLSRPQVTKRIWEYIKSKQLQDPSDRRFIVCDDRLNQIFKQEKVHMFTMTKLLNQQMYNPEE